MFVADAFCDIMFSLLTSGIESECRVCILVTCEGAAVRTSTSGCHLRERERVASSMFIDVSKSGRHLIIPSLSDSGSGLSDTSSC